MPCECCDEKENFNYLLQKLDDKKNSIKENQFNQFSQKLKVQIKNAEDWCFCEVLDEKKAFFATIIKVNSKDYFFEPRVKLCFDCSGTDTSMEFIGHLCVERGVIMNFKNEIVG